MYRRMKNAFWRPYSRALRNWEMQNFGFLLHRHWTILLILALPFLLIMSADYLELLERTGTFGAFIADTMLSAMIFGYCILLYVLKRRRI